MKTVKVDLPLLKKYFSKHYDFESNHGMYFSKESYDIETDVLQKQYLPVYQQISELCINYNLKEFIDTFFNLFFIGFLVKYRQDNVSIRYGFIPGMAYKTQLFTLFQTIFDRKYKKRIIKSIDDISYLLSIDSITVKCTEKKRNLKINDSEINFYPSVETFPISITDKTLLERIQLLVMDETSDLFYRKPFHELSGIETSKLLNDVKDWLKTAEIAKKGGAKITGHYLRIFALDILTFINTETQLTNQIQTYKYEFIGGLFDIYGLKKTTQQTGYSKMISNILNIKD